MANRTFQGCEFLLADASADDVFTPEDFTEDQRAIGQTARGFVEDEVLPRSEEIDAQKFDVVVGLLRRAGELGLLMVDVPEAYGGLELDKATSMLVAERIGVSSSFSVSHSAHSGIGTLPLVYYGTAAQKERYLSRIATGEWIAAYCLTEPGSGSDALGARTTATLTPDGRHYVLEGTKQFITNGRFADLYTVFAKVDGKLFTAFLVERTFPGLTVGPEERKLGIKGSSTTQIILEGVKVPVENVLGEVGKGHKIAFNVLNVGRFKLGAGVTGAAKHAFAEGVRYASDRRQFGVPVARFGALQEKIADLTAAIFASESLVYRLAGLLDTRLATVPRGAPDYYEAYQRGIEEYAAECAIAKVFCSDALALVVDEVVQMHGGYGFVQEYPAEKFYRDERINRIFEGTNEINRVLVASTFLRRAGKGELKGELGPAHALDALGGAAYAAAEGPLGTERCALAGAKHVFLALAAAAARRFGERVRDEQEVLVALADVAIQVFAAESAVVRAERMARTAPASRHALATDAARVFAFDAVERIATAARKAALFTADGEAGPLLEGIRRLARDEPVGLLAAKRRLAVAVIDAQRYPLAD